MNQDWLRKIRKKYQNKLFTDKNKSKPKKYPPQPTPPPKLTSSLDPTPKNHMNTSLNPPPKENANT